MESTQTRGPQQGAALMKRTTKYVALDVHQATTSASVREENGRVIARSVLPTDGAAITEFGGGMRGAVHVALEEGTQAQWLHDLVAPLVDRVVVCDRRGAPRQGNKADQGDADQLSEQLRRGGLRTVYHGSADRATLKELTRTYRNLVEDATRVMLRLKALFRARGIPASGKRVYHPRARAQWLAQLQNPARGSGPKRSTPSSTCCGTCGPGPKRPWSPRRGRIPPGPCFGPFPSSGRAARRRSLPPFRRPCGF